MRPFSRELVLQSSWHHICPDSIVISSGLDEDSPRSMSKRTKLEVFADHPSSMQDKSVTLKQLTNLELELRVDAELGDKTFHEDSIAQLTVDLVEARR